jgi:hypothetical protein
MSEQRLQQLQLEGAVRALHPLMCTKDGRLIEQPKIEQGKSKGPTIC